MKRFYCPLLAILTIFVYKIIESLSVRGFLVKSEIIESMILYQEYVMVKVFGILIVIAIVLAIESYFEITIRIKRKYFR